MQEEGQLPALVDLLAGLRDGLGHGFGSAAEDSNLVYLFDCWSVLAEC